MTKEELIQFLKDNLEITVVHDFDGYICVDLMLCGELISESKDIISNNNW